jgi:hypothetical protein
MKLLLTEHHLLLLLPLVKVIRIILSSTRGSHRCTIDVRKLHLLVLERALHCERVWVVELHLVVFLD